MSIASIGSVATQPSPERRQAPPAATAPASAAASTASSVLGTAAAAEATESPATTALEASHGDPQAMRLQAKHLAAHHAAPRRGHKLHVVV
jgi:hypothetical protein